MVARTEENRVSLLTLCFFALVVGIVTAFGAVVFRAAVAGVHNLFLLGEFSFSYEANHFTPESPWGPFVILSPIIGGLIVVYLVRTFAPEARGHGVPEVMYSIYHKGGEIRPVVALVKTAASALSIGSGAAVGREGPIIQIGSTLGSTFGQIFKLAAAQRTTLLAAGAAAGIAATFNTPLGAVMFAVELMLPEISTRTFLPVVIATGTATYIGRIFIGMQPAFFVPFATDPSLVPLPPSSIAAFVVLGLICGLLALSFIRFLPWMEDRFNNTFKNDYIRNMVGMGIVGCMFYFLFVQYGHYYIEGVSYGAIQATLKGEMTSFSLLLLLFFAKLIATSVSLASGASGGVFAPSLFLGTTAGGAFGAALALIWPEFADSIPQFAMVGMACMVGGSTGGALMAIMMVFEMTRDYNIIIPLIIAVAMAVGVRRALSNETIYTIKLVRRGAKIPTDQHTNMYLVRAAREVMDENFVVLSAKTTAEDAARHLRADKNRKHILVSRGHRIGGVLTPDDLLKSADGETLSDILKSERAHTIALVREDDSVSDVLRRLSKRQGQAMALVVRGKGVPRVENVTGVIARDQVAETVLGSFQH